MQILSAQQQKYLDEFTIKHEPISSIELMNRAAQVFTDELLQWISPKDQVVIVCGTGNNGGDGLVIFRYLKLAGIEARCYLVPFGTMSEACQAQFDLVKSQVFLWDNESLPTDLSENTVVVDALLGIGSNREPQTNLRNAIEWINSLTCQVYAVDMPSGLASDELPSHQCIIHATKTFTFHAPKLTFFLPETAEYIGEWKVLDIGLDQTESAKLPTRFQLMQPADVPLLLPKRKRFSHKGTYGHALLIAGSDGKMGACLLSSEATLRSGVGLLTVHTVSQGKYSLHQRIPEAMVHWDANENELSGKCLPNLIGFSAIGIGPGLGTGEGTRMALEQLLQAQIPCVIDADALNVLSQHPELLEKLHKNCILTPHPKEFERLAGSFGNSLERMERAIHFAEMYRCVLVLKDAVTAVISTQDAVCFNSSGNSGMAKGGSGDVLTGIILGSLAQGIDSFDAARIAVFHHGLAGDQAKQEIGERAMLPRDLIDKLNICCVF